MSDEFRTQVQRLVDAGVPEDEIGKFIKEYQPEPEQSTSAQFIEGLKGADWRGGAQGLGGIIGLSLGGVPGAVLGGMAGGQAYDLGESLLTDKETNLGTQNMRASQDALFEIGANYVLPPALGMVARGVKKSFSPAKNLAMRRFGGGMADDATARLAAIKKAGMKPEIGLVGGAEGESASHALRNAPGSGSVMRDVDTHNMARAREISEMISQKLSSGVDYGGSLGSRIRAASVIAEKGLIATDKKNFIAINKELPDVLPAPRFTEFAQDILDSANMSPLYRDANQAPIKTAAAALEELGEGGVLTRQSRNIIKHNAAGAYERRALGKESLPSDPTMMSMERALYSDVKEGVISSKNPDLLAMWEGANKYHVELMGNKKIGDKGKLAMLRDLMRKEEDGDVASWVIGKSSKGASRIEKIFELVGNDVADDIRASVFLDMAKPRVGARGGKMIAGAADELVEALPEVSFGTFLTNLNKMSPEARNVLFKKAGPEMNDLIILSDYFKTLEKRANFSNTANINVWHALMKPISTGILSGTAVGALTSSTATGLAVTATAVGAKGVQIAAYRRTAHLLTDPQFIKWLTVTGKKIMVKPTDITAQLVRLAGIAMTNPATEADYMSYINALGINVKKSTNQKGETKKIEVIE